LKTPYLLGIITVLLFGSFAMSGMFAQAGMGGLVVTSVKGPPAFLGQGSFDDVSVVFCPAGTQLIAGNFDFRESFSLIRGWEYELVNLSNFVINEHAVIGTTFNSFSGPDIVEFNAIAYCAELTFPMNMGGMIGGELLDIDTMALFVGAIGVNPVITGLVAITMGGVAAQAIWYVNSRRVKKVE